MKRYKPAIIVGLLGGLFAVLWNFDASIFSNHQLEPNKGNYTVTFYNYPERIQKTKNVSGRKVPYVTYRDSSRDAMYSVSYARYPNDSMTPRRRVNLALDGMIRGMNARQLETSTLKQNDLPGRTAKYELTRQAMKRFFDGERKNKTAVGYARIFYKNRKMYILQTLGIKGETSLEKQKKFLDSFEFVEQ